MRKCKISSQQALFAAVSALHPLYLPSDGTDGQAHFVRWTEGTERSSRLNTVKSPKDAFFPQSEDLMAFRMEDKKIDIIDCREEPEDFVIFGIRGCDVRAMEILDKVFLAEPADSYYAARREHALLISAACGRPSETCFCGTFGIDASDPDGDITVWEDDAYLYLQEKTVKGSALMAQLDAVTEPCSDDAADGCKSLARERQEKLPLSGLDLSAFGAGKTDALFNSPEWAELSRSCLGCGTCTFVCPTCQCYDIKDYDTGHGVLRYRCWDSCMYSEFTKMSAGQPRLTQLQRFRQRFMHKLVYFPENNDGVFGCVGCGRCLQKCPIHMNIVKVMRALSADSAPQGGNAHE